MNPKLFRCAILVGALSATCRADLPSPATMAVDPALTRLEEGNIRFQKDPTHPRQDSDRRKATARSQQPFAMVLTCADSRVPVEILFDQGIGDIFVVRVAGNIAGIDETGSIEYGAKHLGVPVCVVMGHTDCGAVRAAVNGGEFDGNLANVVVELAPAVERTRFEHPDLRGDALVTAATETNVWYSIENLFRRSELLRARVREGKLQIVGAIYDLASGQVRWLGPHPDQARLAALK